MKLFKKISRTFIKYLAYVTLAMLLTVFILSQVIYVNFEKTGLDITYDYNKKIVSQLSYNIKYVSESASNFCITQYFNTDIRQLMLSKNVSEFDIQKYINRFNTVVMSNNYVHSAVVYNKELDMFYSTTRGISYNDADVIEKIRSKAKLSYLVPVPRILSKDNNYEETEVLTYYMYDSTDEEGALNGAFVVNIKLDWLKQALKQLRKPDSNAFIINKEGLVISDASSRFKLHDLLTFEYVDKIMKSPLKEASNIEYVGGEKKVITYSSIPNTQWILILEESYDTVFEYINDMKQKTMAVALIFAFFAVLLSIVISSRMYQPLRKLVGNVREKMSQDATIEYPGDDMKYLFSAFNLSASKVEDYAMLRESTEIMLKKDVIKSMLLDNNYTSNHYLKNNFTQLYELLNISSNFVLVSLKIDYFNKFLKLDDGDRKVFKFAICNVADEIFATGDQNGSIDMGNDEVVIMLDASRMNSRDEIRGKIAEIQNYISMYLNFSISAFVSDTITNVSKLSKNYRIVNNISKYRLFYGSSCILESADIREKHLTKNFDYPHDTIKNLLDALMTQNRDEVDKYYQKFIIIYYEASIENLNISLLNLTHSISNLVDDINKNAVTQINVNFNAFYLQLVGSEYLEEINEYFSQLFDTICNRVKVHADNKNDNMVKYINEFIDLNYQDKNLSLMTISSKLKMESVYYLNKIFKKHSGESIQARINAVRLEKAAELIKVKDISVREVFEKVGYDNESNFYKLFKKKYGVTPNEYRLSYSIKEDE